MTARLVVSRLEGGISVGVCGITSVMDGSVFSVILYFLV